MYGACVVALVTNTHVVELVSSTCVVELTSSANTTLVLLSLCTLLLIVCEELLVFKLSTLVTCLGSL